MGLDSVLHRISELERLTGTVRTTAGTPNAAADNAFAATLMQAQQQMGAPGAGATDAADSRSLGGLATTLAASATGAAGLPTAGLPSSSFAGAYPVIGAAGIAPAGMVSFPTSGGAVGQRIVALAQQEVGVAEAPPGSNESPRIRQYRAATAGALNTPGPWCAYFTSWLSQQAGAPIGPGGAGFGWVPSVEKWGKDNGRWLERSQMPQPGDMIVFERNGDGLSDHIGIVESVGVNGTIHTIEGNSSDRVARRSYPATGATIKGYVRPG